MSEREYFSIRYTVPGFVLILAIIGFNYGPLLTLLTSNGALDISTLVIGVLTLATGPAIGFLVSQLWFVLYQSFHGWATILRESGAEERMATLYQWNREKWNRTTHSRRENNDRDAELGASVDYILNHQNDRLFKFFQSKVDLLHTMGSTLVSLIIGLLIGETIRWAAIISPTNGFISTLDLFLFISTIVAGDVFIIVLTYLMSELFFEYNPMLRLVLENSLEDKKNYGKGFVTAFHQHFNGELPNQDETGSS